MKKVISVLLATIMILSCAGIAFADYPNLGNTRWGKCADSSCNQWSTQTFVRSYYQDYDYACRYMNNCNVHAVEYQYGWKCGACRNYTDYSVDDPIRAFYTHSISTCPGQGERSVTQGMNAELFHSLLKVHDNPMGIRVW